MLCCRDHLLYMMVISVNLSDTALTLGSKPLGSSRSNKQDQQRLVLLRCWRTLFVGVVKLADEVEHENSLVVVGPSHRGHATPPLRSRSGSQTRSYLPIMRTSPSSPIVFWTRYLVQMTLRSRHPDDVACHSLFSTRTIIYMKSAPTSLALPFRR